jgi:predicted transcriptional regulator
MLDLFSKPSVRIARIDEVDARKRTDALGDLSDHLRDHSNYYPSIEKWYKTKVVPGLAEGARLGFVGYAGDQPVLAAVIKHGPQAKFCHLSISDGFQGSHLGRLMFSLMAAEVRQAAKEIHFTLPEGLWERESEFFRSFGFTSAQPAHVQYRAFEDELKCSAPWSEVWRHVVEGLPALLANQALAGYEMPDGVVLSVAANHAVAIMNGQKTVEVRRQFSSRWEGRLAGVYASRGCGELLGVVNISRVIRGAPDEIWDAFGPQIGCDKQAYDEYVAQCEYVFALLLAGAHPYHAPISLTQLAHLTGDQLTAPQSYARVTTANEWGRAFAIAALLHGRCDSPIPTARSNAASSVG